MDVNDATRRVTVVPDVGLPPQIRGVAYGFAALLLSVFVVTLMIACANIANLTLARASRRKREVAMKVALGASRARILRQLLAESAIVAAVGGIAGASLALWLIGAAGTLPPIAGVELTLDLGADRTVLLFSTLLTILTVFAVGLIPALRASRADPAHTLKGGHAEGSGPFRWFELRNLLVIGQVAASLVLLVGAGLMLKSVRAAVRLDPGFAVQDVATLSMRLAPEGYSAQQTHDLFEELAVRVARMPGVETVSYTDALPMTPAAGRRRRVSIPGYEPGPGEDMEFQFHAVGPGFMDAFGMELIRGRDVMQADDAAATRVVLVNESFAQRFWPGDDPVGKLVGLGGGEAQVVGLMRDALYRNLQDEGRPAYFVPVGQSPSTGLTLIARTSPGGAEELLPLMRDEVAQMNDRLPISALQTMEEVVAVILLPQRIASMLLSIAGVLGMLLAAAGLYGVMSFLVSQQTREIGLRIALGARAGDVVGRIVRRGVALSAVGAGIGLAIAAFATRLIESLLLNVSPLDASVFSLMALAALVVAGFASWVPARRASSVDPMVALRHE
jgi:predicted permease